MQLIALNATSMLWSYAGISVTVTVGIITELDVIRVTELNVENC